MLSAFEKIEAAAARRENARAQLESCESALQSLVLHYPLSQPHGTREQARRLKLSAGYLSDLRLGRRKISAELLKRLREYQAERVR